MTDALKANGIKFTLHWYKVENRATVEYTLSDGSKTNILVNADAHVIVEIQRTSDGNVETLFFDAGIGVGGLAGKRGFWRHQNWVHRRQE